MNAKVLCKNLKQYEKLFPLEHVKVFCDGKEITHIEIEQGGIEVCFDYVIKLKTKEE